MSFNEQGIPQLRDCFSELKVLTTVMLDKELPVLLLPENAAARRRKYPILSMEKVANILEKYVGTGLVRSCFFVVTLSQAATQWYSACNQLTLPPFPVPSQGDKLMGGAARKTDFLFIDKKEVQVLLKYVKSQGY